MSAPLAIRQRALRILWPSFLLAICLVGMVFSVVDPAEMRWFGGPLIGWSAATIYSVSFFIFWSVISTASALTMLLSLSAREVNRFDAEAGHVLDAHAASDLPPPPLAQRS